MESPSPSTRRLIGLLEQLGLGLAHTVEAKLRHRLVHQGLYLVVAEVAHRALVGMVDVLVGMELARLYLQSHLLIGVAERMPLAARRFTSSTENMGSYIGLSRICSLTAILLIM